MEKKWRSNNQNTLHRCLLGVVFGMFFVNWGFAPHKELHAVAITSLPSPIFSFFKSHQAELVSRATDADKRKHAVDDEAARHYIDLDHFTDGISPCSWKDACVLFSEDTLQNRGVLPWNIEFVYRNLVNEFSQDTLNTKKVIRLCADLGHYVADAHVPLHTASNYNGQFSGQIGIHALWETHVYETTRASWPPRKINAYYIKDIRTWIWQIIQDSHDDVNEVLLKEKTLREIENAPFGYGYRTRGRTLTLVPTPEFCKQYGEAMSGMVEQRFFSAAQAISSIWYSAWADAGAPQLTNQLKPEPSSIKNELIRILQDLRKVDQEHDEDGL
tara:strand:- start:2243 stop:3229 length:987 start_codon:yes stop_codon:yes gene_type:complete